MPFSHPPVAAALAALLSLTVLLDRAAAFTPAEGQAPMTVTLVRSDAKDCGADCPEWLALTGAIGSGTPALLSAALTRLGQRHIPVLVDSPGGAVDAAIVMGRAIRARKLDVVVAGTALTECDDADRACAARRRAGERPGFVAGGLAACASACTLLLAAGAERSVGPNSYVGVHQIILHKTVTRVMNTFRIMRRMVDGRAVEVSRTLIGTRPISSHMVLAAAPEQLYSEVDRYLLGMGTTEAIMPLMRSTPPSGIHWMTPGELAATRIATDTTDARTFVARAVEPKPAPGTMTGAMALASATLGSSVQANGTVEWRVERAPGGPALVGTVEIPDRHLRGTVSIRRETAPSATSAFIASIDLGPPGGIEAGRVWTVDAPRICDAKNCSLPFAPVGARDDGRGRRDFGVIPAWGDTLLSTLRDRDGLSFGLASNDGRHGMMTLSLADNARGPVAEWEHLCCGLAPGVVPRPSESPPPSYAAAPPGPRSVDARAGFSLMETSGGAPPFDGVAALTWTLLAPSDASGPPGAVALIGALTIPEADLYLSVGVAPAEGVGKVVLVLKMVRAPEHFGPERSLSIPPIWGVDAHIAVMLETAGPSQGGEDLRAVLSVLSDVPDGAVLSLEMDDVIGRHLTLRLPTDGPLQTLLRAIGKRHGPAT